MRRSFEGIGAGFTLIEMVTAMSVMAIIAASVAVFLRLPLQAYQDAQRRGVLTAAADTAFTLLKRDLQKALPNSVRITTAGADFYLEFLQIRTGGRYRAEAPLPAVASGASTCPDADADTFANENVLGFGAADACFTTLGSLGDLTTIVPDTDFLVVYNLGAGYTEADAYATGAVTGGNKSLITAAAAGSAGENVISFEPHTFPLESPGRRFHVISGPVTYMCDTASGTLRRFSGYPIAAGQPAPPVGGTSARVAQGIAACTVTYDQNAINQRTGIVSLWLRFSDPAGGASVNLFQQVQVSNVP
jgi:MSHA biogenesis protein MshO